MKNWIAAPLLVLAMSAQGQSLLNPDLDNFDNGGNETLNDAPDNWAIIGGTPDVVDGDNAGGVCDDSDVDVCGIYAPGTSNKLFARLRNSNNSFTCGSLTAEGIEQTVSGLTVGAPYQICFFAINVGKGDNCENIPANDPEDVNLQIQVSGQSDKPVNIPYEGTASAPTWDKFCANYTATSTSHTLGVTMPAGGTSDGTGHVFYDTIQNTLATDTDGDGNADINDPNDNTPFVANDTGSGTAGVASTYNILSNDDFLSNNDVTNVGTTTLSNLGAGTAAGTISLNAATGELTYTPTIAEGGTSPTVNYRVCNVAPVTDVCADATVTIAVATAIDSDGDGSPDVVDANDNTPTAVNDSGNATAGEAATFDILANDDFLDNNDSNNIGTTAITNLGTGTAAGTIAFDNNTGELTYTPTIAEGGTAPTVNYRVCNTDTSVCDTATVTITVAAATDTDNDGSPDVIDANDNTPTALDDSGNGTVGVAGSISILANDDFLTNSDPNNVGTTAITNEGSGTAAGTIAFDNNSGELTYTPTLAEAGSSPTVVYQVCNTDTSVCDTATVTINVGAATDTDGDGSPDVVDQNDSAATAVNDSGNGVAGEAGDIDILANDDFLPNNNPNNVGTTAITDVGTGTAAGSIAFNNNTGELTYTPTIAEGGTAPTVIYQVCNTDTSVCDTATVTITVATATDSDNDGNPDVTDPNDNTATAVDESTSGSPGITGTFNILANDDFLANNDANNAGTTAITDTGTGTATGAIAFDNNTGELSYTPTVAEGGTAPTVIYQVCNTDTSVCDTATVTINVSAAIDTDNDGSPDLVDANDNTATALDDSGNGVPDVAGSINILANDDFLPNNDPNNVGTTAITNFGGGTATGTILFNANTGELIYTPTVAEGGSDRTVIYEVCNTDTSVCATATATITVSTAADTDNDGNPDASDPNPATATAAGDSANAIAGEAVTVDLLGNDDFLPNNAGNNVGTTAITNEGSGNAAGTIAFNNGTGELIYTPTLAEAGTSPTVVYEVCNTDTSVCATATVTITVAAATDTDGDGNPDINDPDNNTPTVRNDSGSGTPGVAGTLNILANDDFLPNNDANNVGTTTIANLGTGTGAGTVALDANTGELTYTPTVAEGGNAPTVVYEVCNFDTSVCATATVTITVSAATDTDGDGNADVNDANVNTPTAADDSGSGSAGVADSINILANDDFLPNSDANNLGTTAITNEGSGTATGTIVFDANTGELTYTPTIAEGGTSPTVVYEVCNTDTSACDTATATIAVAVAIDTDGDGSPDVIDTNDNTPTAVDDSGSGSSGVAGSINILANDDFLPNNDANNVGTTAITDTGTGTATGSIAFDADTGEFTYTPTVAEGGNAPTMVYEVCNTDTGACDTATVTIAVAAATDTDSDGNPDFNDADASNPVARNDAANGAAGVAGALNILANDDFLPNNDANNVGTTAMSNVGTGTATGTIAFDANTGELTYTPTIAEGGTSPTVVYEVCNTDTNVCDTATAIISVAAAADADNDGNPDSTDPNVNTPTAQADSGNADPAVAVTVNVLLNDDFLPNNDPGNGGTTTLTNTGNGSGGGSVVLDPASGEITYTPLPAEAGQAVTVEYEVCNTAPTTAVCDTALLTVSVSVGPDADNDGNPDATDPNVNAATATDESGGGTPNVAASYDVLANDDFLPNNAPNNAGTTTLVNLGTGSAAGTINTDASTGEISYTPTGAEAGSSVTIDYEVCNTDPASDVCASATLTVNVATGPDVDMDGNPDATDPNVNTATAVNDSGNGSVGVTGNYDLLSNDDFLPNNAANNAGVTTLADLGTGNAAGTIVLNAQTGLLDYTPTQAEANTSVTVNYEVCNTGPDPDVCAQAIATIAIAAAAGPDNDSDGTPNVIDPDPDAPIANDETVSGDVDVEAIYDILGNDDFLPGNNANGVGTIAITDTGSGTAAGAISFDAAAGTLTYTPTVAEQGMAVTVVYEVCNTDPATDVCATATVTINVAALPDTDMDGIPDSVEGTADTDGDGLPDFNDPDADNDGIPDAVEAGNLPSVPVDSDADGLPDYLDLDSDGDRIIDYLEAFATPMVPVDSDNDGLPDYIDTDSDNDNIPDTLEAVNPPVLSGNDADSDGIDDAVDIDLAGINDDNLNGVADEFEPADTDADGKSNHLDLDSDADGLLDKLESVLVPEPVSNDVDNDGIDDSIDVDATGGNDLNNNGIKDALEPLDTDRDGNPDYLDIDADNDSIPDAVEAAPNGSTLPILSGADTDNDGIDDAVDADNGGDVTDVNNNGISDNGEPVNTDDALNAANGDATPDYRDLDSDNDSLLDLEEAGNGTAPAEVNDVNMDGVVDTPADEASVPVPADSDGDGIPDYRDLESTNAANNGAGPYDLSTNPTPPADNGAGMVNDPADDDGDGIANSADPQPDAFGGGTDSDLDGLPNDMDLDDDNDGIPDLLEGFNPGNPAASTDTDGDGVPDYLDLDSDNDGLTDLIESSPTAVDADNDGRIDSPVDVLDENGAAGMDGVDDTRAVDVPLDTDNDGIPDFRDLDSDGDGISDLAESVPAGTDPSTLDSDADGVQDAIDPLSGRPISNGQLIPLDTDMDGDLDFRVAAAFNLATLPPSNGSGLRTSVSGGGGSAGLMLIMLGLPLLYRLLAARRLRLRGSEALGVCVVLLASGSMLGSPPAQAADSKQTLCGYHFDDDKRRITSGDQQEQDSGSFGKCWYGGVGVTYSHLHPEGRDSSRGWETDNDKDAGWSVLIGKRLNEHWFAELKYADQGAAGLESSGEAGSATLNADFPDAGISYRTASLMLGRYLRDSDQQFNWYAKAGIASINNDSEEVAEDKIVFNEVTTEQFAFGLGAEYRFGTSRWFARLNADFYDQDAILAGLSINRYLGGTREGAITPAVAAPLPTVIKPDLAPTQAPVVQDRAREVLQQRRDQQRSADCANFDGIVEGINFETDSARLISESRFKLLAYARSLSMYPATVVRVSAHTDWVGNGAYNQSLSERRAAAVVEYLVQSGVQRSQLQSRGYGETMPIADNNTRSGRARNRRVELSIIVSPECGR